MVATEESNTVLIWLKNVHYKSRRGFLQIAMDFFFAQITAAITNHYAKQLLHIMRDFSTNYMYSKQLVVSQRKEQLSVHFKHQHFPISFLFTKST